MWPTLPPQHPGTVRVADAPTSWSGAEETRRGRVRGGRRPLLISPRAAAAQLVVALWGGRGLARSTAELDPPAHLASEALQRESKAMRNRDSAPGAALVAASRCAAEREPDTRQTTAGQRCSGRKGSRTHDMTHCRKRTGSRPQGGLPVRFGKKATWTLVLGTALTLSALSPDRAGGDRGDRCNACGRPRATSVHARLARHARGRDEPGHGNQRPRRRRGRLEPSRTGRPTGSSGATGRWPTSASSRPGLLLGRGHQRPRATSSGVSGFEDGPRSAVIWRNGAITCARDAARRTGQHRDSRSTTSGTVVGVSQSRIRQPRLRLAERRHA